MTELPEGPAAAPAWLRARIVERAGETPQAERSGRRLSMLGTAAVVAPYLVVLCVLWLPPRPREQHQSAVFVQRSVELAEELWALCKVPGEGEEPL